MNAAASLEILRRPRRKRITAGVRSLVQETKLHRDNFVQPLFFYDGQGGPEKIPSMPGVVRHSLSSLLEECHQLVDLRLSAIALFPCIDPSKKEPLGMHALASENVLYKAIRTIKKNFPHLVVIADVALDPYTSHGHDGLLDDRGEVENDATVAMLARLAVAEAEAGADIVAPSDMMDGRVKAIRMALDKERFEKTLIMAYSAKYASAYYGPFRDAVGSKKVSTSASDFNSCNAIDKRGYQMDPANLQEALLEVKLDEEEGADIVMVKPAGAYLDVIRAVQERTHLPVAAYQVSGEYAQICAVSQLGWLDYKATRDEALLAIKRAGASIILSYFAKEMLEVL